MDKTCYLFSSISETVYSWKTRDYKTPARWVMYAQYTRERCWNRLWKKYANAVPKMTLQLRLAHFTCLESTCNNARKCHLTGHKTDIALVCYVWGSNEHTIRSRKISPEQKTVMIQKGVVYFSLQCKWKNKNRISWFLHTTRSFNTIEIVLIDSVFSLWLSNS